MAQYTNLIAENIAPHNAKRIGVYNESGLRVGGISLGNLVKEKGQKLYSFGALSDVHIQYDTAPEDFQKALTYLNETEDVAFTCVCGDLTSNATAENLGVYKNYVNTYSPATPVYSIAGNHESYSASWGQNGEETVVNLMETVIGQPIRYSFTHGDDVFIMLGIVADYSSFGTGGLQWLYETLEANRNKRCFVFQHIRPDDACGNAYGIYTNDIWGGTEATVFESLIKHYKNVIFFHGHSHLKFALQTKTNLANIDTKFGRYSVHIPSLSVPKTGSIDGTNLTELFSESEGYVVDVYENGVHLRGRDFVKGEFLPIASYWLDTTLQTVDAGTYTDSTGTITT